MDERALLQQPHRPAGPRSRNRTQLAHPGRQSRSLGVDHAGRGLLPQSVPDCSAAASPPRSRSPSRCSSSVAPAVIRPALRSARRLAASGSALLAGVPASPSLPSFSTARSRRPSSHFSAQSGARPACTAFSSPPQSSSSPTRACRGVAGSDNCTCTRAPWCPRPSDTACCHCPCRAPTPLPCRSCLLRTTARPCRACFPPCVMRRQEPVPAPGPTSSAPPAVSW